MSGDIRLSVERLAKRFTLHQQGGLSIPVFEDVSFAVGAGEVVALTGASGRGKSSLLKLVYGTYKATAGAIRVLHQDRFVDIARAEPREIMAMRRTSLSYVTQFLRVIPRVAAIDIVSEPMIERGASAHTARERAAQLLSRLAIPERLWGLPPATFSGGEQQRVNIARGFAAPAPLLLLDEPTASLDRDNRGRVLALVEDARRAGSAVLAVFHDERERQAACTRSVAL